MVVNVLDEDYGDLKSAKITIKYDYIPKYCLECKIQGHDKDNYRILHPKLSEYSYDNKDNIDIEREINEPKLP